MDKVLTLTMNPALDMSTSIDTVVSEQKLRCKEPRYEPGGGGINVSRAIRKLGGTSTATYLAGGHTGQLFRHLLSDEGIEQIPVPIQERTRESMTIFEESSTQQYRFNLPGPAIRDDEVETMLAKLEALEPAPRYLVVSGSLPPGVDEGVFGALTQLAQSKDIRLVVDTSGPPLRAALDGGVFLIKPNLRELGALVGRQVQGDQDLEQVARNIVVDGGSKAVLVSLGAGGAVLVTAENVIRYRAPTVAIQSKVGAGDSMVGGVVLFLAQGETLMEAACYGVAAGAAAVMTPGSMLCRVEDTNRLYQQMCDEQNEFVSGRLWAESPAGPDTATV